MMLTLCKDIATLTEVSTHTIVLLWIQICALNVYDLVIRLIPGGPVKNVEARVNTQLRHILHVLINYASQQNRTVAYNEPNSLWYAAIPADLDLSDSVGFPDFSIFAEQWEGAGCTEPDWCQRADIDRSGDVGWLDLDIIGDNWLLGL